MRGVLGLGLRLGMGFGRGFAAVTRFVIDLLTATTLNSQSTIMGYDTASALTDGKSVLLVPVNTPSIKNGRQLADNSWSGSANPIAHTFNGASKDPYTYCTAIGDSFTSGSDYSKHTEDIDVFAVIVDQGISGNTTTEMLARFQHDILDTQTRVVIVQGGVNDLAAAGADPNATMQSNVTSMLNQAVASGKSVVLINVGPWSNHASWNSNRQTWTETYNTAMESFASINNIPFVDIYDLLRDGTALAAAFDSGDGLHPNTAGYTDIGTELATIGENTFSNNIESSAIEGVALVNEDAGENVLIRSILSGSGSLPTGWSVLVGTGTSLLKPSIFGSEDGAQALQFVASAERPSIFINVPFAANTEYTVSTILEDMTARSVDPVILITGVGIVSGSVSAIAPIGARPGDIITTTFVTDGIGGVGSRIRYGIGGSGLETGDMTFSRPQIETGSRRTSFIPTDTISEQRSADITTVAVPSFVEQGVDWAFKFRGTPRQTAQALKALFSFDSDATNYTEIQLNAANITANSVLLGVSNGAAVGLYSHTVDVPFETNVYYVAATKTLGIRSDDVSGDISSVAFVEAVLTSHPVITATLSTGNRNDLNQSLCDFGNDGVPIFYINKETVNW